MTKPKSPRQSDPKIRQLGWENLEPDALIDRTVQKIKDAADDAKRRAERPLPDPEPVQP
jgi:hypothetical protein